MITQHTLDSYLGKSISQICPNGIANPLDDHGAHFVAHVLNVRAGLTCQVTGGGKSPGASLRVQDIFPRCPSVGVWSLRPSSLTTCLVFIAGASQVKLGAKQLNNVSRKHVGIYLGGLIWHYAATQQRVVKQTPAQFGQYYPAPDNAMFFGALP